MSAELTATVERPPRRVERARQAPRQYPQGLIRTTILFLLAAYFALPMYWLAVSSTKSTSSLFGSGGLWFSHPQFWQNLASLFRYDDRSYLQWALNSILYAGVGAIGATLLAVMAGYGLAKHDFPGRNLVFSLILAGVLVPVTALALPLYLLASKIGIVDTYWSVLVPGLVSPFGVYLARVYVEQALPDDLLDAARIDGAGEWVIFVRIVLPVVKPAVVTIFLFQFVSIWNNFFLPLIMLSSQHLFPITLGLQSWSTRATREPVLYSLVVAGSLVSVVPLVLAVILLQRFWQSGLTAGSVK